MEQFSSVTEIHYSALEKKAQVLEWWCSRLSGNHCPRCLSNIQPDRLNNSGWRGEGSRMRAMLIQLVIMSNHREIKWTNRRSNHRLVVSRFLAETCLHCNVSDQAVTLDRWTVSWLDKAQDYTKSQTPPPQNSSSILTNKQKGRVMVRFEILGRKNPRRQTDLEGKTEKRL